VGSALVISLWSGCAYLPDSSGLKLPTFSKKENLPDHVVAIWTDTVLQQPGQRGVRGVGGRLMFYGVDDKTLPVDGTLTVFAYDDTEGQSTSVPARKYVFLPEHVEQHYSKSKLGHSYSFWLPWEESGGPTQELTLVARFEPTGGGAITSEPSRQLLPGVTSQPVVEKIADYGTKTEVVASSEGIKQASHNTSANKAKKKATMDTITIDVPPNFVSTRSGATSLGQPSLHENAVMQAGRPLDTVRQFARQAMSLEPTTEEAATGVGTARKDAREAGLPPQTLQAPGESNPRPGVGLSQTRQRLESWLADRRASRRSAPAEKSTSRR